MTASTNSQHTYGCSSPAPAAAAVAAVEAEAAATAASSTPLPVRTHLPTSVCVACPRRARIPHRRIAHSNGRRRRIPLYTRAGPVRAVSLPLWFARPLVLSHSLYGALHSPAVVVSLSLAFPSPATAAAHPSVRPSISRPRLSYSFGRRVSVIFFFSGFFSLFTAAAALR